MSGWELALGLAGHHLIPCLLASAIIWALLSLALWPLRRPADRVPFLYLSILKGMVALCAGVGMSCLAPNQTIHGTLSLRLPDLVREGSPLEPRRLALGFAYSGVTGYAVIAVLAIGLALLVRRWVRLAPVYRRVYDAEPAREAQYPELFRAFEELVNRTRWVSARLPKPRLLIVKNAPAAACAIGVQRPVIVLSWDLVGRLGARGSRGIIAHELGHVKRMDYLGRWLARILRDVMIWNPAVVAWYEQLELEQEKAADEFAAELLQDPGAVAAGLVEIAAYGQRLPPGFVGPSAGGRSRRPRKLLDNRLEALGEINDAPLPRRPQHARWLALALLAFLIVQPQVAVSLPNLLTTIRRLL